MIPFEIKIFAKRSIYSTLGSKGLKISALNYFL